jgi:ABC-type branched-chain amino acid transport systems, periplasmic component
VKNPANEAFIKTWQTFTKNPKRVTNDPMEAHVIGFNMWVEAVKKAGTTDPDKVIAAIIGVKVPNLTGGISEMLPNHHITKPVLIGEIRPTASSMSSGRPRAWCQVLLGRRSSTTPRTWWPIGRRR